MYETTSNPGIEIFFLSIKAVTIIMHVIMTNNILGGLKKEGMFNFSVNEANLVGIRNNENKIGKRK